MTPAWRSDDHGTTAVAPTTPVAHRPAGPSRRVRAVALLGAAASTIAVVVPMLAPEAAAAKDAPATNDPTAGRTLEVVVRDGFARQVASGWGTTPQGTDYSVAGSSGTVSVTDGRALMSAVAPGQTVTAATAARPAADLAARVSLDTAAAGKAGAVKVYAGLTLRQQANGAGYAVRVITTETGAATLDITRQSASGDRVTLLNTALPAAKGALTLDAAAVGNRIFARAYAANAAASAWTTVTDTAAGAVTTAGTVAVTDYVSSSSVAATTSVDNLLVWTLKPARTKPTPPTTPTPPTPPTPPTAPTTPVLSLPQPNAAAGAARLGTTNYPVPAGAVFVAPNGSDTAAGSISAPFATVNRAAKALGGSGTIVLRGGTYHQAVTLYTGSYTISSFPGEVVWFDGSTPVTSWTRTGATWTATGWNAQFDHSASFSKGSDAGGFVNAKHPLAAYPDQLFVDGAQYDQVAKNPVGKQFAVDYAAHTLTMGTDPAGHEVRASDLQQAFVLGAKANLLGFGVRRYATSLPQMSTVYFGGDGAGSSGSLVENVVVTDNATQGIMMTKPGIRFSHLTVTNNGMTGICATYADNGTVDNALVTGNNTQHFNAAPAAAGMKILRLSGFTARDNVVTDNQGIGGIWTDENVIDFSITGNYVADNGMDTYGIEVELSDTGVIAGNTVIGTRYAITAFDSGNVQIVNNTISRSAVWGVGLSQDDRYKPGKGTAGPNVQPSPAAPWIVQNILVANNVFLDDMGVAQFYALDKMTNRSAFSMNVTIRGNVFVARTGNSGSWPVAWGRNDNKTTDNFGTVADLSVIGCLFPNTWFVSSDRPEHDASITMPLTSAIASAVGRPVGTQQFGVFQPE